MPEKEAYTISQERLDQLLEFEITGLAHQDSHPLTLGCVLEMASTNCETTLARLLYEELPVRFAQRVKMIEALPDWQNKTSIAHVREMYVASFKELRQMDPSQPAKFARHIAAIQERHARTHLLVGGFKQYVEVDELGEEQINDWLDRFFALRISTNMLLSHYLEVARANSIVSTSEKMESDGDFIYRTSLDPECEPLKVAEYAAHVVRRLCQMHYGVAPGIVVKDCSSKGFAFVPRYFFYILAELLKNSVRATVEMHLGVGWNADETGRPPMLWREEALPPVHVYVSNDDKGTCCVRVSDEGGGIPVDQLNHVWSYLYTTAEPLDGPLTRESVLDPPELRRVNRAAEERRSSTSSPLAGLGCGMPLCRLYATYLGGSIELQTLPRYGTDVFVYLKQLGGDGTGSKHLPHL